METLSVFSDNKKHKFNNFIVTLAMRKKKKSDNGPPEHKDIITNSRRCCMCFSNNNLTEAYVLFCLGTKELERAKVLEK